MTMTELKKAEIVEFKKAFEVGTVEAWKKYTATVKRLAKKFEKETGLRVDLDALMA